MESISKHQQSPEVFNMEKLLFTVPEVAGQLGLGRSLVYQLVMRGEIDSIKVGRARRVPAEALERFIQEKFADEANPEG